jgi:hypothetical protein
MERPVLVIVFPRPADKRCGLCERQGPSLVARSDCPTN